MTLTGPSSYQENLNAIHRGLSVLLGEIPDSSVSPPETHPVDIRTFIKHHDYCGDTGFWEKPLQELEQILAPGCKGAVIEKGIRGSKSYTTSYIPVYLTYRLMFEEIILGQDPRLKYDLDPVATVIYNAIFTINGKLARRLFNYISNFVERCAWFKRPDVRAKLQLNDEMKSELQWCPVVDGKIQRDRPRYAIYPGHSKLSSAAGVALYTYILDECNLFTVAGSAGSSGLDYAEALDEECDQRVTSSFGEDGQRIYISRRNTVSDFTTRKKEKWAALPDGHSRYYIPPPKASWEDWPKIRCEREEWRLFVAPVLDWAKGPDGKTLPSRSYKEIKHLDGLWIPQRFWDNFSSDPESALKVLASIPAEAQEPFIRRPDKILPDWELKSPIKKSTKPEDWMREGVEFDDLVEDWFYGDPELKYHFHCDLALNKDNRGDSCGLTLAHSSGIDEVALASGEARPEKTALIDIDAIFCIRAPRGSEIEFERVRQILYWLKHERGFKLRNSSYDGWQSIDSFQILKRKGIPMERLSLDKDLEHYQTFKDTLYEGRLFFYPAHGQTPQTPYAALLRMAEAGDPSAIFQVELRRLELINGKKVDHPPKGSKDCADATCGAVVQCTRHMRRARDDE